MIRVISRLDIKGPNVVKTVRTEGLRVVGNPKDIARKYYEEGADEIIYIDIVASLYQRNLDFEQLKAVSENIFVPLTVGGGIRSLHDIALALAAGADKVAINTFAIHNPEFLKEAAEKFGSQCIVLFIEAKKVAPGKWEAYTDGGREKTNLDVLTWVKKGMEMGVGEILLTSIDMDGIRDGYDTDLIKEVNAISTVPVIAHGGAGKAIDALKAIQSGADAVSLSSVFHYNLLSIGQVKETLRDNKVKIRL
ncbi:MAG: imidazole glycerol phosphate synthase cyclase subunit [bacterium]|nr:imidazole glycerol phosphate synthase cyclase subunit [bacterium]